MSEKDESKGHQRESPEETEENFWKKKDGSKEKREFKCRNSLGGRISTIYRDPR